MIAANVVVTILASVAALAAVAGAMVWAERVQSRKAKPTPTAKPQTRPPTAMPLSTRPVLRPTVAKAILVQKGKA